MHLNQFNFLYNSHIFDIYVNKAYKFEWILIRKKVVVELNKITLIDVIFEISDM